MLSSRRTDCQEPYIPQDRLERIVEEVYGGLELSQQDENDLRTALERELAEEVSFSAEKLVMTQRRLARAEFEREKLLQAYFADALPLDQFKREQTRIAAEIDGARAELAKAEAADSPYQTMLETALSYIRDARSGYANADPYVKRLWNRTLIERIEIKGGQLAGVALKEPFAGLFLLASSNKGTLVGEAGFEPATT